MDNKYNLKSIIFYSLLLIAIIVIVYVIFNYIPSEYHRIIRTTCYLLGAVVATIQAKRMSNKNK